MLLSSEAAFPSQLEPGTCSSAFSALTTGARNHSFLLFLSNPLDARDVAKTESSNAFIDAHHSFKVFREKMRKPRDNSKKNAGL